MDNVIASSSADGGSYLLTIGRTNRLLKGTGAFDFDFRAMRGCGEAARVVIVREGEVEDVVSAARALLEHGRTVMAVLDKQLSTLHGMLCGADFPTAGTLYVVLALGYELVSLPAVYNSVFGCGTCIYREAVRRRPSLSERIERGHILVSDPEWRESVRDGINTIGFLRSAAKPLVNPRHGIIVDTRTAGIEKTSDFTVVCRCESRDPTGRTEVFERNMIHGCGGHMLERLSVDHRRVPGFCIAAASPQPALGTQKGFGIATNRTLAETKAKFEAYERNLALVLDRGAKQPCESLASSCSGRPEGYPDANLGAHTVVATRLQDGRQYAIPREWFSRSSPATHRSVSTAAHQSSVSAVSSAMYEMCERDSVVRAFGSGKLHSIDWEKLANLELLAAIKRAGLRVNMYLCDDAPCATILAFLSADGRVGCLGSASASTVSDAMSSAVFNGIGELLAFSGSGQLFSLPRVCAIAPALEIGALDMVRYQGGVSDSIQYYDPLAFELTELAERNGLKGISVVAVSSEVALSPKHLNAPLYSDIVALS